MASNPFGVTDEEYDAYWAKLKLAYFVLILGRSVSLGIQLFVSLSSLSLFFETSPSSRQGRWPYVAVSMLVCSMTVVRFSLEATVYYIKQILAPDSLDLPTLNKMGHAQGALWMVSMLIVDGVLLFRCFAIYHDFRRVVILPGVLYLGTIGLGLAQLITSTSTVTISNLPAYYATNLARRLVLASFNLTITTLIISRLLKAHNRLRHLLPDTPHRSQQMTKIIAMLIESSLPAALAGALTMVAESLAFTHLVDPSAYNANWQWRVRHGAAIDTLSSISNLLFEELAIIFPLVITYRVIAAQTWSKTWDNGYSTSGAVVTSLAFAHTQRSAEEGAGIESELSDGSTDSEGRRDGERESNAWDGVGEKPVLNVLKH